MIDQRGCDFESGCLCASCQRVRSEQKACNETKRFKAIDHQCHRPAMWSTHDYSVPSTICIGYLDVGEIVIQVQKKFPGIQVRRDSGEVCWVNEWDLERIT